MKKELLIGCGNNLEKRIRLTAENIGWSMLTTLDHDPSCNPDVIWDLNELPLPFPTDEFDEIHAYEILEHLGRQGDYISFFGLFNEIWRILKPGGNFFASVPSQTSDWLWGDPGHTRAISQYSIVFLSQEAYKEQIGFTTMTDYRRVYHGDFKIIHTRDAHGVFSFILMAVKGGSCGIR